MLTEPTDKASRLSSSKQAKKVVKFNLLNPTGDTRDSNQCQDEPIQVKDSQNTAQEIASSSEEQAKLRTENDILRAECARLETNWDELFELLGEKQSRLTARIEQLQSEKQRLAEQAAQMESSGYIEAEEESDD
ncbi:uncharacterized protein BDW47DRAFT_51954 [Aspergillus candidus]|uniref:Uncharacterized protein n=1 Tax=Aspergillus candidus TaxID=41067 RepID=A0A2I2F6D3_ASPCN|nr:hypothetical protein BDW47DRAFT_51954 [Aspergillus candidus]PLB36204.1 hypothetical protein BDW47DRAFT_51954 [Aspergillus candidus]